MPTPQEIKKETELLAGLGLPRVKVWPVRSDWYTSDGGLPSELKGLRNICAPEVAAMWLVAYWMGRLQGAR